MLLDFGCPLWFFLEEDGTPDGDFASLVACGMDGSFASLAACGVDSGGLTDTAPPVLFEPCGGCMHIYVYLFILIEISS